MTAISVGDVLAWVKQPISLLLSFDVFVGPLIFGPGWISRDLGINQFVLQYRLAIGVSFVITFIVIIAALISLVSAYVSNKFWVRKQSKRLHDLTPQEKKILKMFVENNTRSIPLDVANGVVGGLVSEKIIYRSVNISLRGTVFSHNIQPWAWNYLRKNPHLIDD